MSASAGQHTLEQSIPGKTNPFVVNKLLGAWSKQPEFINMARSPTPHTCTKDCRWYCDRRAPDHFVCMQTGKVHVCGDACAAKHMITKESTKVCTLTGIELEDCGLVTSYSDMSRVLAPSQYNFQEERRQSRNWKIKENLANVLFEIIPTSPDPGAVERFVGLCHSVFGSLCRVVNCLDKNSEKSFTNFTFAMVLYFLKRNSITTEPLGLFRGLDFQTVNQKAVKRNVPIAKMQKKIIGLLQNKTYRVYFKEFNKLKKI